MARLQIRDVLLAAALCAAPAPLAAQGAGSVAAADLAYVDIDRLHALGLLDSMIVGQRPYSRREVGRIAAAARANLTGRGLAADEAEAIVARLARRFADDASARSARPRLRFDELELAAGRHDATSRRFPSEFGAPVEAEVRPLISDRRGRREPRAWSGTLEPSAQVDLARWLTLSVRGRIEGTAGTARVTGGAGSAADDRAWGEVLLATARARYRNAVLTAGREQLAWSTSPNAGLFIAANAPALDQVSLTSDAPFRLPWVLGVLGPTRATLAVAELGASAARSRSKLLTYKVSSRPTRELEIGATFLDQFGGQGGRPSSLTNRLIDFLPFVDLFRTHNYLDTTRTLDVDSNKLLGVDGRVVLRRLGGTVVAGELLIDDFDVNRLPSLLTWDGAQTLDVLVPRLGGSRLSLRLAARHTGVRTYTHHLLRSGVATRGRLLGSPLGPDAKSFGAGVDWHHSPALRLTADARSSIYSSADYESVQRGTYFVIRRTGPAVNELTDELTGSAIVHGQQGYAVKARLGIARVRNAEFGGARRYAHAAAISVHRLR